MAIGAGNRDRSVQDLTKGNIYRLILKFALPVLLSQIFQQLYNTADTFIVGRFLGTEALAAVGSSGTLIWLMISFVEGTAMGAGVVIARYFGAGDTRKVSDAIHTDVALGILSGVILTVAGVLLTPTFLVWMKTDPDVLPEAVSYFRYYFLGSLAVVLYNNCRGIMNALGDSTRPLYYLIFSSVLNVILDVLFVGVFRWGVWSAAVATVIAQGMSLFLCLLRLCRKGEIYSIQWNKVRFHGPILREILRYGFPSGVQNSVIGFANVMVQTQINSFGKFAMAAYGAQAKIEGFAFMPINSFAMTVTTFVGQNLGAGQYDRAKKGARFSILAAALISGLIGVVYYFLAPQIISAFDSSPEVIGYGVTHARISSLFYLPLAVSHAVAAVCRGAGKASVPMVVMLSVWCIFRVAYIELVMHLLHDIVYVYWAYPITWCMTMVIFLLYYWCSDWVHGFDRESRRTA